MNKFATGVKVAPCSIGFLREIGHKLRKMFGLAEIDYLPVPRLLEVLQTQYDNFGFYICEKNELPKDVYATYNPLLGYVVIKETYYDMACEGNGFARWTITHEIAHHILHRNQVASLLRAKTNVPHPIYEDSEWQANILTRELMIPYDRIPNDTTVQEIVKRFGVSQAAATNTLKSIRKERGIMQ